MSDNEERNEKFKIVLVGDNASGKTSIASKYCHGHFQKKYVPTEGVDFFLKRLELPGEINVTLQIWDVGGQTIGGNMINKYLYGSDAILIVFDITRLESFNNVECWMDTIDRILKESVKKPLICLLANKSDLEAMRSVCQIVIDKFACSKDVSNILVSANSGNSVDDCFNQIISMLLGLSPYVNKNNCAKASSSTMKRSSVSDRGSKAIAKLREDTKKIDSKSSSTCSVS